MKLLSLLLTAILCATASAQTIKTLGYNSTNGVVVASTGTNVLTFTNNKTKFSGGDITIEAPGIWWAATANGINLEETYLSWEGQERLRWQEENIQINVPLTFSGTNTASTTRANLGFGATWLTNTNVTNFRTAIGLGATNQPTFSGMYVSDGTNAVFLAVSSVNVFELYSPLWFGDRNSTNAIFQFEIDTDAAIARTNLGLPLAALTNTSNVTTMRALAGSTNTNEPYSGTVALTNTNVLTFSNGVLLKIQ